MFITVFTKTRHWFCAGEVNPFKSLRFVPLKSISILLYYLRLFVLPTKILYVFLVSPMPRRSIMPPLKGRGRWVAVQKRGDAGWECI
jgi:hypothetical protein